VIAYPRYSISFLRCYLLPSSSGQQCHRVSDPISCDYDVGGGPRWGHAAEAEWGRLMCQSGPSRLHRLMGVVAAEAKGFVEIFVLNLHVRRDRSGALYTLGLSRAGHRAAGAAGRCHRPAHVG
jgi:hypothetical protein